MSLNTSVNDLPTRDAIDVLKDGDFVQYEMEIAKPWQTMEADMAFFQAQIEAANAKTQTGKVGMGVYFNPQADGIDLEVPDWLLTTLTHFDEKYGVDYGSVVLEKVLHQMWQSCVPEQRMALKIQAPSE